MSISFSEKEQIFHLTNGRISYVIGVLPNGQLTQLYNGRAVRDVSGFNRYREGSWSKSMTAFLSEEDPSFSLEITRQEYPSFGTTDMREPAFELLFENGSHVSEFRMTGHTISRGKPALPGLPASYTEDDSEAETLAVTLKDEQSGLTQTLFYTIFENEDILARSTSFSNQGTKAVRIERAMSLCLDLPDADYEWMQFSGAWARERQPYTRKLVPGIQAVESMRGHSSGHQNPFVILKRESTTEDAGEAIGCMFVYSGNFLAEAYVDTYGTTRLLMGINPKNFCWNLKPGDTFQTPEALLAYSFCGLNRMSQTLHRLLRTRVARGYWRDRERPILLNSWEAVFMDFNEEKLLDIAKKGKEAGVELFVLDDGWFGNRIDDHRALGDWTVDRRKLPNDMKGLAGKVNDMGLAFGLWIEPEMINEDSDLYRAHPDWVLSTPGRNRSYGRFQWVLDFSRKDVVDGIYDMLYRIFSDANISYVKWDMNRTITECYSAAYPPGQQGEIYHRYILGVYRLYERLIEAFPRILFESCASGGCRFDAGMLYYAPQAWGSDDTDAIERLKIHYGTSYGYPLNSLGAHVSVSPNQQVGRAVPIETRANVACFGTFGYELDLNELSEEEFTKVQEEIVFMKKNRLVLHHGDFYRIKPPFDNTSAAWMVVSEDGSEAIVGYYKILNAVNRGFIRLKLYGLEKDARYEIEGMGEYGGDELMNAGIIIFDEQAANRTDPDIGHQLDFWSRLYILHKIK